MRTGFLRQSISVPVLSSRQIVFRSCWSDFNGISCRKAPQYRCGKKRSPSRIEWLSMSRLKFAHLSIDVIKLAILRWVVWRVRALRCFESPRTAFGSPSRRSMLALLAFVSFSPTLDPFGVGTEMRCVLHAPSRRGERLISRTTACERPCARL